MTKRSLPFATYRLQFNREFTFNQAREIVPYLARLGVSHVYASPILSDGKIYYVGRDGRTAIVAARPKYELLASNDLRDRSMFNASPAAADGRLYLRSESHLYCVGK